jgi:hypothetical protein
MKLLCKKLRFHLKQLEVTEDQIDPLPEGESPTDGMLATQLLLEESINEAGSILDELEGECTREESSVQVDDKTLEKMLMQVETFSQQLAQTTILYDNYRTMFLDRREIKAKEKKEKSKEKATKHQQMMETLFGVSTAVTSTLNALADAARPT